MPNVKPPTRAKDRPNGLVLRPAICLKALSSKLRRLMATACSTQLLLPHVLGSQPEAHSVLRAKVAQHYKKNSERYSLVWDKEIPDRSAAGSFQDYIAAIAQVDTWAGHMELAALARLYDIKFVIFP